MNTQRPFTDESITSALLGSEQARDEVFAYLYQKSGWRAWLINHVMHEGGSEQAGEDVFQETIILFDRNIREHRFKGGSALRTYFLGIGKQYWFNRQRGIKPISLEQSPEKPHHDTPENLYLTDERIQIIQEILEKIGEHCKKVLSLYKLSLSNEEIAQALGLSSPELAKKYAYRCREKFKSYVLERKEIMEHLDIKYSDEK